MRKGSKAAAPAAAGGCDMSCEILTKDKTTSSKRRIFEIAKVCLFVAYLKNEETQRKFAEKI